METVYIVRFESTGETWQTMVCENLDAARSVAAAYGCSEQRYASADEGYVAFKDPRDKSQTATAVRHRIVLSTKEN